MFGIHLLDFAVIVGYLVLVIFLGQRAAKKAGSGQENYFLAGRKLGKVYQFFLNFGNSTDANGAVSAASIVYQQGVSGIWLGFQLIFLNPYYWFMNLWFRRVRLVTTADLFEDRLGSRKLASFYAVFQMIASIVVVIGFGNLVTYKISSALAVKPEASWTATERSAIEGHRELRQLELATKARTATAVEEARLKVLRELDARGELKSYITALKPLPFYLVYTIVVGAYVILGGMAATAVNEVLQSLIIVAFSIILIPAGLAAIGGFSALQEKVPAAMFELIGADAAKQQITAWSLFAIGLVALVQINGIIGNMGISGSAKNEFAARFGAVSGTYAKRLMFIMWAFVGLIAVALYQGENALSDPDLVWGTLSRQVLGPGLLGLMLTGVLAANMSTVAAQTVSIAALFVRNVYRPLRPGASEAASVGAGRVSMFAALAIGIIAALSMDSLLSALLLVQTVSVPFGAAIMLMFFWRRLTVAGTWVGVLGAIVINVAGPLVLTHVPALRTHETLVQRAVDARGRPEPIYFDSVVRVDPTNPQSALEGRGRLHLELVSLRLMGVHVESMSPSGRFAARFLFDALFPFALLIGVSLLTRPPAAERVNAFYGRMKTPVGATPEEEEAGVAATRRQPDRFDHTKLFRHSSWEFTKWDRTDAVGFLVCCAISGANHRPLCRAPALGGPGLSRAGPTRRSRDSAVAKCPALL
jgi:SSS family solute:Na+ symporter